MANTDILPELSECVRDMLRDQQNPSKMDRLQDALAVLDGQLSCNAYYDEWKSFRNPFKLECWTCHQKYEANRHG